MMLEQEIPQPGISGRERQIAGRYPLNLLAGISALRKRGEGGKQVVQQAPFDREYEIVEVLEGIGVPGE
jgi:hypothetical protein